MAGIRGYWTLAAAAIAFRILLLFCLPKDFHLGSHPEITTPLTSLRRLAEGYWLKQASMSPYSGSMYHGSPVLLSILGPLSTKRSEGRPPHFYCSLLFVLVDFITATLIRATGKKLMLSRHKHLQILNLSKLVEASGFVDSGDFAALMYLWNPMTIVICIGSSTSPIDNLMVVMAIYGACSRIPPLAAFGWVFAVHLSLYPVILIVPIILLLGYGLDAPPSKSFLLKNSYARKNSTLAKIQVNSGTSSQTDKAINHFLWIPVLHFALWVSVWLGYVLVLSSISLKGIGSITEMFRKTYGFILTVEDLSPNIGLLWYFFAEVFDFFRNFFLIVFHVNILFVILPLAIRLKHRPCFLAFVYIAISSMLKSYPSLADSTLYLSLVTLFSNELADMQFSFFLFCGYIAVSLFSPVMHNLWIWRGTGNANFYYATGLAYACLQTILVVESVGSMLKHDRLLRKTVEAEH
ncbi:phosphatidylinositol glycan anchor biosynthesis class U protein-like [Zingiber officinale]|uniref:phosphatidylinositol glycan anchor biosynthesis class U protein-like n=1 Tax=Zingiber officinale TaxID=94328 RepID=UPI001C4CCF96|nr:phosphatidylinositol glycan anchor biosynthesis class U protein-like [Zingiber officinale]